jgi:hypothetical protein
MATKAAMKSGKVDNILEFDTDAIKRTEDKVAKETDKQILARLAERFEILDEMTEAVRSGSIRAMIVSGPPGVGKSHGVEKVLEKAGLLDILAERKQKYEVCKGAMSAIGLYAKLYEFSAAGNVVVFDDCDSILYDNLSLNILKGALDSSERRFISWNTDSRLLRSEGIPDRFEFCGSAIFITNIKFEHVRSKTLRSHLDALESRCHYIDLQMDTQREKLLRIHQVVTDGKMLERYEFEQSAADEVVQFVMDSKDTLRELSLRMVLKIADLRKGFPKSWKSMAKTTCMTRA